MYLATEDALDGRDCHGRSRSGTEIEGRAAEEHELHDCYLSMLLTLTDCGMKVGQVGSLLAQTQSNSRERSSFLR